MGPSTLPAFHEDSNGWTIEGASELEDCNNKLNLAVLSTLSPAHLHFSYLTWSILNILIVSASMTGSIHTYRHKDLAGSDHLSVLISLTTPNFRPPISKRRWNYQRTNWGKTSTSLRRENPCFKLFHLKKCTLNGLSGMCEVEAERVKFFFFNILIYTFKVVVELELVGWWKRVRKFKLNWKLRLV